LQARQDAALENGSLLILFPDGSPMRLESHKDGKSNGKFMTWYADGTIQSEESFVDEKLLQGKYFSADGTLIAEVLDGRGKRIEFEPAEDGRTFVPRTETEYVDGLKDGKKTSFAWEAGRVLAETHYHKGVKDGTNKAWARNGQLTLLENYLAGNKHGESIFWHDNGNLLFTAQYDHGVQVGVSNRYAKSGQKIEETFRSGKDVLAETRWYPEGAMMVCKKYDPATLKLVEAQSFDRSGQVNGTVQDGRGKLVVCESLNGYLEDEESFALEQYLGGNTPNRIELPTLHLNSVQRENDTLKFRFRTDKIPGIDELNAQIEPLVPGTEPVTVELKAINKKKAVPSTIVPVPGEAASWSGTIYAQCTAKGKLGTYSFTQIVFSAEK
jgi:antitoxin component YwqK of YwqJK toxin-antitoxin module